MSSSKVSRRDLNEVVAEVAKFLDRPVEDLFVADHTHGDVRSEGSFSVALEGDYDWPSRFVNAQYADRTVSVDVFIEPVAGWCLGVYPA